MSIPAPWAPSELKAVYEERLKQGSDTSPLLTRLVSDPRMEKVWRSIGKRTNKMSRSMMLGIFSLVVFMGYQEPKKPLSEYKHKYHRISELAYELSVEMRDSTLSHELSESVIAIEKLAKSTEYNIDNIFLPYKFIDRIDLIDSPKKTIITRWIYIIFMSEFRQPLWKTIAALVEVLLDLEADTVTVDFVRGACRGIAMRSSQQTCT